MSPLTIEIMLLCHCSPEPWRNMASQIWNSPAAREARDLLCECGLIDVEHRATDAGHAYVDALCSVPIHSH